MYGLFGERYYLCHRDVLIEHFTPAETHTNRYNFNTCQEGSDCGQAPELRFRNAAKAHNKTTDKKQEVMVHHRPERSEAGLGFCRVPFPYGLAHPSNDFISKHKSPKTTQSTGIRPQHSRSTCKNSLTWHDAQISLLGPILRVKSLA